MRLSRFVITALALSSVGCVNALDAPDGKAGFLTLDLFSTTGGGYAVRPFGVFYDETNLRFDQTSPGRCAILPFFGDDTQFANGKTMNVGESVVTTLPTGSDALVPVEEFGFTFYRSQNDGGIALVPGDTMTFTITGGEGFPAATIADATPEVFTVEEVGVPVVAEPIPVTWTAPGLEGSIINVSLRFADDFSEGAVNRQISCWFTDDGADQVPASFVDGWIRAKDDLREVVVTRLRSKVVEVAEDVELTMISTLAVIPGTPAP